MPALIGASARNTVLGRVSNGLSRVLGRVSDPVERALARRGPDALAFPPVFIVGAPRTGSTALYQLVADHFDVGYLTNLHCWFHGMPSVVERWIAEGARDEVAYESSFGTTEGWLAPSECGAFWYRFFPRRPHHVEHLDAGTSRDLRRVVGRLGDACGKPVLFKNLHCSMRIRPLAAALPEAVFLVVRRDTAEVAYSMLRAMREVDHEDGSVWSVEPPGMVSGPDTPAAERVVEQIRRIYATIDRDLAAAGTDRHLTLDYSAMCEDPEATILTLVGFFERAGLNIARISDSAPTAVREARRPSRPDDPLWHEVLEATA